MKTVNTNLDTNDCVEIYYALRGDPLTDKIGPDGACLASGMVSLTEEDIRTCIAFVELKRDAVLDGHYDEFTGEIEIPGSDSAEWVEHLSRIIETLQTMASGHNTVTD